MIRYLLCILAIVASQSVAGRDSLPYTTLALSHTETKGDDDVDASGQTIAGTLAIGSNVFIGAAYDRAETDDFDVGPFNGTVEGTGWAAVIGFHQPLTRSVDLVPSAAYLQQELEGTGDFSGIEDDDSGYGLALGLRALLTPMIEASGGIAYVDIFDETTTTFRVDAAVYPIDQIGITLGYSMNSDATNYTVGLQANFD